MEKTGVLRGHIALILFALTLSLGFQRPAEAQEGYSISLDQLVVEPGGAIITAFVSVLDPAGQPVGGLTGFSATIDNTAAEIEDIEAAENGEIPIAALLAIDVSGSMAGAPIEQAKSAARTFLAGLGPNDRVAVVTFADTVDEVLPFSTDRAAASAAIDSLTTSDGGEVNDGTALYDATIASVRAAVSSGNPRATVILLSDGVDSASSATLQEAVSETDNSPVPVFTISLGGSADLDPAYLRYLAQISGARFSHIPSPEGLAQVYASLAELLRGQYSLTIAVPESDLTTPRELAVRIELGGEILTARSTFDPQAATTSSDGGGSSTGTVVLILVLAIGVVGLATAAAFWYRRRRQLRRLPKAGRGQVATVPSQPYERQAPDVPVGELAVISGPNAGATVPLASQPVDIGAAQDCALRLDGVDGTALHHARVWLQRDRFVLHHLAAGAQTFVGDRHVEWATLESDDTLRIGPHIIVVRLKKDQSLMS